MPQKQKRFFKNSLRCIQKKPLNLTLFFPFYSTCVFTRLTPSTVLLSYFFFKHLLPVIYFNFLYLVKFTLQPRLQHHLSTYKIL